MAVTICTDRLTKHYGQLAALVDLDLKIEAGEVFGFLGPNGAGKTTAIRTILDEIRPTSGSARILGMDTHEHAVELRRHVGYVPGDLALYPNLTGRETLRYFANLRGGVDWGVVDELAARLHADLGKKVGDLSSGNRQKVGLIQAFMNKPKVLIMDEPSTGLDPLMQREFQTMLREVASAGGTVFLSSHTLSEVERVADRVGIIRRGRLVAVEGVAALRAKAIRRVELLLDRTAEPGWFDGVDGAREVSAADARVTVSLDGPMELLLKAATAHASVLDITTHEADLEEIFLTYYREEGAG